MRTKRKINVYTKDINNNHLYEFSTLTEKTLSQTASTFACVVSNVKNIKKHNGRFVHLKKPISRHLKQSKVIMIYASYK